MPYDFKPGESIKYITLDKDTQTEMFYYGGEYVKIGNELIFLHYGIAVIGHSFYKIKR